MFVIACVELHVVNVHCVPKTTSPSLLLWYLCQISSDFANLWQKHTPGNLKQNMYTAQFISHFICS